MPDPYSQITTVDETVADLLINAMEVRAADPRQRQIREEFLSAIDFPDDAAVLEVGCGSGAVCRDLAKWPKVARVTGLDPSPAFLAKARELASDLDNVDFVEGDGRALPQRDAEVDVVLFHTCLTHVPEPEKAIAEAVRVLKPGGQLACLDGDYVTTSVAVGDDDPLQVCVDTMIANFVHDCWLARRLPRLISAAGLHVTHVGSHGYLKTEAPDYMLTLVDRGADLLAKAGQITPALAESLKGEARARVDRGQFFGFISFVSVIAERREAKL